jgi:hypothetical protein
VAITVAAGQIGTYEQQLIANTVLTVNFTDDLDNVEVITNGAAAVYFTVDGSTPTIPSGAVGSSCYYLPAAAGSKEVHPPTAGGTTVKLISSGTPTISIART